MARKNDLDNILGRNAHLDKLLGRNDYGIPSNNEMAHAQIVPSIPSTAKIAEDIQKSIQAKIDWETRNDEAIQRNAENSGKQVKLLEEQLQEVQEQNEMLQTQNEMLKEEFAANRKDIEANAKANKHTRIFSIITTIVNMAIALAGLIVAIA